ncbi:pyridoxamine 5'-phosphate oxidase family protein [Diaminobutyricimonas sp. LJ205]|uniref:pyridoxamine 5'-phosphate oxidase family protein n=1 Tax=Diaminobutyricimonas sp. LJ205 TaxID=2683590 RepID=UPI0012F47EA0|nr:pyridoxamine 5'-phosphate oxidase family protein [Diaminobutyricimonas sp. LJ205]
MSTIPTTSRTSIRRLPERQQTDREQIYAALDAGLVAHVAVVRDGYPVVLPVGYGRSGDDLFIHGSTGSGIFREIADGRPVAVCVTHLDGLVFARSTFDSSMNYRSVVVLGRAEKLEHAEKSAALEVIVDNLMPGRREEVRPITKRELAATLVLRIPLTEASMKVRAKGASEEADDGEDRSVWAGVLPILRVAGEPESSGLTPATVTVPASVRQAAAKVEGVLAGSTV